MNSTLTCGALAALSLLCASAEGQQFSHDISLSGLGNGHAAKPFGIAYEPTTDRIFVAISGSFGAENDVVAVIDPATDLVIASIQTELFPEEIAFAYDANGKLEYGAVTNSSSGSLTVFDAGLNLLGHVALPDPFGLGSCFPFGVVYDEQSERFFVTTLDGSGDVHAVDPLNLNVDAAASVSLGFAAGSRALLIGGASPQLWTGTTRYNAGFTNSEAFIAQVDLTNGTSSETLLVDETRSSFASVQDIALTPQGRVLVGGSGIASTVYQLDGTSGEVLRTLHLPSAGSAHGLAVDPSGELLAVCDLGGDRVVLADLLNSAELASFQVNQLGLGYGLPNDAVFAHGKLYATSQATEEVMVFDQLPDPVPTRGYAGSLTLTDATPKPSGQPESATVTGDGAVALAVARDGEGGSLSGFALEIGPNPVLRATGVGNASLSLTVPANSALRGTTLWLQGIVDINVAPAPTEPRVVIVQ